MAFLDEDLISYFMNGKFNSQLFSVPSMLSGIVGRCVLTIYENRYEKVQIYRGMDTSDGFRVTSGWRERGVFKT